MPDRAGPEGWRMTGSALQAMDVIVQLLLGEKVYKGREFEGGRVKNQPGWGGWRMTGSAGTFSVPAGRFNKKGLPKEEGVWGRRSCQIAPGRRAGG